MSTSEPPPSLPSVEKGATAIPPVGDVVTQPKPIKCYWCGSTLTAFDLVNVGGRPVAVCKAGAA